jgi:ferredoxin
MRVTVDKSVCIRAGHCLLEVPTVFGAEDDGTVDLVTESPSPELWEDVHEAADLCPSGAIRLED